MTGFPNNVVDVLAEELVVVDGVESVLKRGLAPTDKNGSVGIAVEEWLPESWEMAGGSFEPTTSQYQLAIYHLVKHTNAIEGERLHREIASSIRSMLYRDESLQLALRSLRANEDNRTERILRWGCTGQRYASNDIDGQFVFASVTQFVVHTEIA